MCLRLYLVLMGDLCSDAQDPLTFLIRACCATLSQSFYPRPWCPHLHNGEAKSPPGVFLSLKLLVIALLFLQHWEDLLREQMWKYLEHSRTAQ